MTYAMHSSKGLLSELNYTQDGTSYDNMAMNKTTLGNKMIVISPYAKCFTIYANHCTRGNVEAVFTLINVDSFSNGGPPLIDLATPVDKNINAGDS